MENFQKKNFLNYLDLSSDEFWDVIDRFRQDHLWEKKGQKHRCCNLKRLFPGRY